MNPDVVKRVEFLWEELRDERANQYAAVDAIHVVATAMLGFESVLMTLVPGLDLAVGWLVAAMVALASSIVFFLWALLRRPPGAPQKWWEKSGGTLTTIDPEELAKLIREPSDQVLLRLYRAERAMVKQNLTRLIKPKRKLVNRGAYLFLTAFLILGFGAAARLAGG
ncbi:hypothetical protein ACH4U6_24130 [Streptomyces netropsis]|uniref:hypothetical protein n=1 Tax=Streptomyces netropsis TaxID=55404 RepID=UPI0037BB9882